MKRIFSFLLVLLFAASVYAQMKQPEKYTIEQYLRIRSASSPSFSPIGDRVAFLSNVTGTNQVWIVPATGGAPKQLTNYEDNVGFVAFSPVDDAVVFGKAAGGDENTQFFWMRADGSGVKTLTNDPKVRHNFGDWSGDGKRIFYASNKRNRNYFDIYAMDVSDGKEELILQHDGSNSVAAVSKDGKRIVVSRSGVELSLDNDLYLVDVATKNVTHLTPHEGAAQFGDVHFLDNNRITLTTNDKCEFQEIRIMNLSAPKIEGGCTAKMDVDAVEIADDGKTRAISINNQGASDLFTPPLNNASSSRFPVQLPGKGVVSGLELDKNGSKLAFTFSGAKFNPDIWIYDLRNKKLSQLTKSDRAGIPQESFVEPELIKFKSFDGAEIPAWFYRPKASITFQTGPTTVAGKFNQKNNLPVIVSVHGGPESQERPGFNALYQYYLSRGYAVLATNVRGSTGYGKTYSHLDDVEKREDSVKDLAAAHEWLVKSGGGDPKRIAVMGGSYGGYMTMAAITLYPDLWAAAVNTVGIVNWETFLKNTSGYRRRQREVEYGRLDRDLEFLRGISPIAKIDRIKTPLMVIHGKNDPRVPYTEAEQIVEALRKRGAAVEYKLFDDEGHGISKLKNRLVVYPLVADFLDKHLKMK
ncbi:MAG: S9 family peptidase [Acidobacteriota bacterium]|nr:S9 family peptidase [Acidobacteriota bacterium]